jgi:hypothetical protein
MRFLVLLVALAGACDSPPAPVDAGPQYDLLLSPFCTCPSGQGCLRAIVTRAADTSMQPWVTFAKMGSDGVGTLVVSLLRGGAVLQRSTIEGADFKPASSSYPLDFGCVDPDTYTFHAFLDDNLDAAPTDDTSADYHDSCLANRDPTQAISSAQIITTMLPLANSCD